MRTQDAHQLIPPSVRGDALARARDPWRHQPQVLPAGNDIISSQLGRYAGESFTCFLCAAGRAGEVREGPTTRRREDVDIDASPSWPRLGKTRGVRLSGVPVLLETRR